MPADGAPSQRQMQLGALFEFGHTPERLQWDRGRKLQIELRAGEAVYGQTSAARSNLPLATRLDLDPRAHIALERLNHSHQLATSGGRVLRQIRALSQRERIRHT